MSAFCDVIGNEVEAARQEIARAIDVVDAELVLRRPAAGRARDGPVDARRRRCRRSSSLNMWKPLCDSSA